MSAVSVIDQLARICRKHLTGQWDRRMAIAKEVWGERAAIREHDGGLERGEAERLAVEDAWAAFGGSA